MERERVEALARWLCRRDDADPDCMQTTYENGIDESWPLWRSYEAPAREALALTQPAPVELSEAEPFVVVFGRAMHAFAANDMETVITCRDEIARRLSAGRGGAATVEFVGEVERVGTDEHTGQPRVLIHGEPLEIRGAAMCVCRGKYRFTATPIATEATGQEEGNE